VWTRGLARWYAEHGRHGLPWRATADPWAILLSEVMLQQTQVSRVRGRWEAVLERWPTAAGFAAAPLEDVLRAWDGLGYPRRALALHRTAALVSTRGWPATEAGLLALPGVGRYTARALLVLAFGGSRATVPADVNVSRIASRAALGVELGDASAAAIDAVVAAGRPRGLSRRDYTYALFDAGAQHCRALPRCAGCPLAPTCAARRSLPVARTLARRRPPRYQGGTRELRGALLRAILDGVPADDGRTLAQRVNGCAAAHGTGAVEAALNGLRREGLVR
jgi:A/G-specific adenine glycosylase